MTFDPELTPGQHVSNQDICGIFGCSPQGGMRKNNSHNCLVIFTDHAQSLYDDRWDSDGVLHYTGMGRVGDQTLSRGNKTLAKSIGTGTRVFYFERFTGKSTDYVFFGEVELAGSPYQESQPDTDGNSRRVWVFPLKLITSDSAPDILAEELTVTLAARQKAVKVLSDQELIKRLGDRSTSSPGFGRRVAAVQYPRNPLVIEYALRRAQGCCELCDQPAPFLKRGGDPFLEVHHIQWLANSGPDTVENVAALCPNCHRRMHALDDAADRRKLKRAAGAQL